jgi:hypothetical protein
MSVFRPLHLPFHLAQFVAYVKYSHMSLASACQNFDFDLSQSFSNSSLTCLQQRTHPEQGLSNALFVGFKTSAKIFS